MDEKLTTLHDALQKSATEPRNAPANALVTSSFRGDKDVVDQAQEICVLNGTTLSGFLRQCVIGLVQDYKA